MTLSQPPTSSILKRPDGVGNVDDVPASTDASVAMSRSLKKLRFSFVGPTICYAFMQAAGLVNDHTVDCFRYRPLSGD